ncbi:protein of unknown function [Chryseobacterium sp. JV274]|nr:protein of unknown function [Chryseobacterium sp. JV274]
MTADTYNFYNSYPELNGLQRYYKLLFNPFKLLKYWIILIII